MVSLIAIFEFFRIPGICSALVVLGGAVSGFWAAWDLPYAWPSTARVVGGRFQHTQQNFIAALLSAACTASADVERQPRLQYQRLYLKN
jgi:hypothetical protein